MMRWIPGIRIRGLALGCSLWTCATLANEPLLQDGDRVVFLGDSITSSEKPVDEVDLSFLSMAERKKLEAAYKGMTLEEQLNAVDEDPQMIRFRKMREAKAEDPYRPLFHLSTPEGLMNDPNGFCYWNGNYHLFYQLQAAGTNGMQWAHAISSDLVHWQDLPLAIRQEEKSGRIFSGQVLVEPERVIAMFHDTSFGNCIALADDPLLLAFAKTGVNRYGSGKFTGQGFQRLFDPCIWKGKDGAYYSVSGVAKNGGRTGDGFPVADLFRSEDLENWTYLGTLLDDEDWTRMGLGAGDDAAVPNFQPIAHRDGSPSGKHMFLWFSHGKGAHALVGTYDEDAKHFSPESYQRLTYGPVYKGTLHAPSAMVDPAGRLLAVFNIRENMQDVSGALHTRSPFVWYGIMSLVRHFWVDENHQLRMEPAGDLASLRRNHQRVERKDLVADKEWVLPGVIGTALELRVVLDPQQAERVGVTVLRSPDGREKTRVVYDPSAGTLTLDVSEGSQREGVPERAPEIGPLVLEPGEELELRIFVDRSVVEVFANERQALVARVYPGGTDSEGVSVFAEGGAVRLLSLDAWTMGSIWPELMGKSSQ